MNQGYQVTTIAGNGKSGFEDGKALETMFHEPWGVCISKDGRLYVSDIADHMIRMIFHNQVATIAGNGMPGFKDRNTDEAMFNGPHGICISREGRLYVTDKFNKRIRMIFNDQVTTIAGNGNYGFQDGNALNSMFRDPNGICISNDDKIYIADQGNHRIRMIHNNQVTTIAGNGQKGFKDGNALNSIFADPSGICCSKDGRIYVSDEFNHRIRMIHDGQVSTVAGNGRQGFQDGKATEAMFSFPGAICISNDGRIYVFDYNNDRIRMFYKNQVTTIAGNGQTGFRDGNALQAMFLDPSGLCCSEDGKLYITDTTNHRIRMLYDTKAHLGLQSQKPTFGFGLLYNQSAARPHLKLGPNVLSDCQITFNGVTYHLHRTLINVQCPLLFDKDYFSLLQESNISNVTFEAFLTLSYSYRGQFDSTILVAQLIFIFDLFRNSKIILLHFKELLEKQFKMTPIKELAIDLLPMIYNLKELIKRKLKTSYTENCYDILVRELQNKRSELAEYLKELHQKLDSEAFIGFIKDLISEKCQTESPNDESYVEVGTSLQDMAQLAFDKTNFCEIENQETLNISSLISTEHLDAWTKPDFIIKLCKNDGDDDEVVEYHVHKLILCGRWKYFYQMIESGLKESNDNQMTLSDDWNKSRFEKMMKYIYLYEIEFDELDDIAWLMKNSKLYGITVDKSENNNTLSEQSNQPSDKIGSNQSKKSMYEINQIAAVGFESLFEHCICVLYQPLTLSNCIHLYAVFQELGIQSRIEQAFNFISANLLTLMKHKSTRNCIRKLVEQDKRMVGLFFDHYDQYQ